LFALARIEEAEYFSKKLFSISSKLQFAMRNKLVNFFVCVKPYRFALLLEGSDSLLAVLEGEIFHHHLLKK
jgi:hypothetical protein